MQVSSGTYYDGRSSQGLAVRLEPQADGRLAVRGPGVERQDPLSDVQLEQQPGHAQPRLYWTDGAMVELHDQTLVALFAHRPTTQLQGLLLWAERHRWGLVASVALIGATLSGLVLVGLPLLASGVSAALPRALEGQLGKAALAELDRELLRPSRLSPERQGRLQTLLEKVQPLPPSPRRLELVVRESPQLGANALCLPGGVLVVTDGLVQLASEDELLAVLAHEAGHDQHRHPLQMLVRGQALGVVIGLMGETGRPLRGLGQAMVTTAYSRGFEHEADRAAVATLERWNRPPEAFIAILDKLERERGHQAIPTLLLTHPSTRDRQARARAGARSLPP